MGEAHICSPISDLGLEEKKVRVEASTAHTVKVINLVM